MLGKFRIAHFMFLSCDSLHNDNVFNLIKVEKTLLSNVLMRFPSKMSDSKFSKHLNERIEMSRIALLNSDKVNLKKLYFNIFRPLSGLKRLSCTENAIAYMNVSTFHTLQHLDLSENNIYVMPAFCDVINNKSAVPQLNMRRHPVQ
jgi:hypothetical protein